MARGSLVLCRWRNSVRLGIGGSERFDASQTMLVESNLKFEGSTGTASGFVLLRWCWRNKTWEVWSAELMPSGADASKAVGLLMDKLAFWANSSSLVLSTLCVNHTLLQSFSLAVCLIGLALLQDQVANPYPTYSSGRSGHGQACQSEAGEPSNKRLKS